MSYTSDDEFDQLFNATETPLSTAQVRQVEKIASEQLLRGYQALQQGVATVQQMTAKAVRKTEEAHPGFVQRYQDPEICRKFIDQRPAVARAILNAESGMGTDSLPELYEIFDESTRSYAEQTGNRGSSMTTPASGSASVLSLAQINALPPERRREHIAALGERVGDVPLDDADSESARFKRERGE